MRSKTQWWTVGVACVIALGASGCGAATEVANSPTASPSPSPSPEPDLSPGEFDVNEVIDIVGELAPQGEFAWTNTRAKDQAANAQFASDDYETSPARCAAIWDAFWLRFDDDKSRRPADEPLTDSRVSPILAFSEGPAPEDFQYLASFVVRVLDEPERGRTHVVDAVRDAAEPCADGWIVTDLFLDWDMQNVTSLEPLPELTDLPAVVTAVAFRVEHSDSAWPPEVWVFATMENLAFSYVYVLDPEIAESSEEHGQSVAVEILTAFAESGAAA